MVSAAGGQVVAGQSRADDGWAVPRTGDGRADLQGVWSNNGATPLERPVIFGDRADLTEEEMALIEQRADQLVNGAEDAGASVFGDYLFRQAVEDPSLQLFDTQTGNYNAFWIVDRTFDDMRTSLIIDPPDGRIPPMTEEALIRQRSSYGGGRFDGPETMSLNDRCITYGAPNLMTGYNSYFQIAQTSTHVVILQELIHDARVIPLDARPDLDDDILQWHGSSRGHWEGDTLVIETKNYSPKSGFLLSAGSASANIRVIERLSRADADTLRYEVTFHDETKWTSPWTALIFMQRTDDALFEYACHEGNYAMEGMLAGARAQEAVAAEDR
jgi:hypothetical protein